MCVWQFDFSSFGKIASYSLINKCLRGLNTKHSRPSFYEEFQLLPTKMSHNFPTIHMAHGPPWVLRPCTWLPKDITGRRVSRGSMGGQTSKLSALQRFEFMAKPDEIEKERWHGSFQPICFWCDFNHQYVHFWCSRGFLLFLQHEMIRSFLL